VQAFADVKALDFDVFGTVVDWRSGVAREAARFLARHANAPAGSRNQKSAVDRQRVPGCERRSLRAKPNHCLSDFLRGPKPAHWMHGERSRMNRRFVGREPRPVGHVGLDYPRSDRVYANAGRGVFNRRGLGQSDDAVLAGVIGRTQSSANQSRDGGHVHDCPFGGDDVRKLVFQAQKYARQIDGDDLVPIRLRIFDERREGRPLDAGVVKGML
jgi:hypothetical protein